MGATSIIPLKTRFAQVGKLNTERDHRHLVEAAEQSERYTLPTLLPLTSLEDFLASLTKPCLWAYERLTGPLPTHPEAAPHTVLVGPEGGFAPEEVTLLQNHQFIRPFTLGPTILRTDTAVVAALTRLSLTS
jgi:16S rRNA (uracil1498-N3)-methyltransferase